MLLAALAVAALLAAPEGAQGITLRPGQPALADVRVPTPSESLPDADAARAELSLVPERACRWVVRPGEVLEVAASAGVAGADRAVLTVWDWENHPAAQRSLPMPSRSSIHLRVEGRGTYLLTLDALRGEQCLARLVRSFSACLPNEGRRSAWRRSGFWIGQCSFPGRFGGVSSPPGLTEAETLDLDAELVARMGAQVARLDWEVGWRSQEGTDLDFALADRCAKAFTAQGLPFVVHLFGYGGPVLPRYAAFAGDARYPLQEGPYRQFVRRMVERYAPHAAFFQVGNEPDCPGQYRGTPEEYLDALRQAAQEVRAAAPRARLTNGGYTLVTPEAGKAIIAGARGQADFVAYHYHGDLPGLKAHLAEIRRLHQAAGYAAPRFANTEMGLAMPSVGREPEAAAIILQKLVYCWAHGDEGVLLYSSREPVYGQAKLCLRQWGTQTPDYGYMDYFFCPRPIYGAASAFLDWYAGARFEGIVRESDTLHAYAFRQGQERLLAFFTLGQPAEAVLSTDGTHAQLVDAMGNATPVDARAPIRVIARHYPQTLVATGASRVGIEAGSMP